MRRTAAIAEKELRRFLRKPFNLIMMFMAPLLITLLLYSAFGGFAESEETPSGVITLALVNLDTGSRGQKAGNLLSEFLSSEELSAIITVVPFTSEEEIYNSIAEQKSNMGLIIPPSFSEQVFSNKDAATITILHDPTLTVAPVIIQELVEQFTSGLSGAVITAETVIRQITSRNLVPNLREVQTAAEEYGAWLEEKTAGGSESAFQVKKPESLTAENGCAVPFEETSITATIMISMIIFFVFFIGANAAQSLIREKEEGNLTRQRTTPVRTSEIMVGTFVAIFLILLVQITILLVVSKLLFSIRWGRIGSVILVTSSLIVLAGSFGIFVMSFVNNSRQVGPVLGSVLTVTGMLGGLFTSGNPNAPDMLAGITLFMPQGLALQGWKKVLRGAEPCMLTSNVILCFGLGAAFLICGIFLFHRKITERDDFV